jgi:hypothetical protein
MNMEHWIIFKDSATLAIGATTAFVGLKTYMENATTRRLEFLVDLHKTFFTQDRYKSVRMILDSDEEGTNKRANLVLEEPEEFIEYLNLFELVAYHNRYQDHALEDTKAMFGYYLRLMNRDVAIRSYIRDTQNGYEYLNRLLDKLDKSNG